MKLRLFLPKLKKLRPPIVLRRVSGVSMMPTLPPGKAIIALAWYRSLKIGDIIIFEHEGLDKVKRISNIHGQLLFVLGDNADSSTDSLTFGWINQSQILARVIWPK